MAQPPSTVYVVDDDRSVRQALARLVRSAGMRAEVFATVRELMNFSRFAPRACVVSDVRMPGTSGLDLPALLAQKGLKLPVIFVTAYETEEYLAAARRAGAAAFFRKPVDDQVLLDAIDRAVEAAQPTGDPLGACRT